MASMFERVLALVNSDLAAKIAEEDKKRRELEEKKEKTRKMLPAKAGGEVTGQYVKAGASSVTEILDDNVRQTIFVVGDSVTVPDLDIADSVSLTAVRQDGLGGNFIFEGIAGTAKGGSFSAKFGASLGIQHEAKHSRREESGGNHGNSHG